MHNAQSHVEHEPLCDAASGIRACGPLLQQARKLRNLCGLGVRAMPKAVRAKVGTLRDLGICCLHARTIFDAPPVTGELHLDHQPRAKDYVVA